MLDSDANGSRGTLSTSDGDDDDDTELTDSGLVSRYRFALAASVAGSRLGDGNRYGSVVVGVVVAVICGDGCVSSGLCAVSDALLLLFVAVELAVALTADAGAAPLLLLLGSGRGFQFLMYDRSLASFFVGRAGWDGVLALPLSCRSHSSSSRC